MKGEKQVRRVGLMLPALNEEEALPLVLAEIPSGLVARIVVVDNGSTDSTAEVALAAGAEVVPELQRGYGRACLTGIATLTSGPNALADDDVIVFLDADHSDYPEDLPNLLDPIASGQAEFVIGSRVLGGASMKALLPQAWFGNRLATGMMRLFFGARYTDLGPFRALTVAALERMRMQDETFGWTIEMQLKAHSQEIATCEVPVRYRPRIGTSKITGTISGTVRAGVKIIGWILWWRLQPRAVREGRNYSA